MNSKLRIDLPTLHEAQQKIVDYPARFKVLSCGRRFGKTAVALDQIAAHLLDGHFVAYFAPTDIMTGEVWEITKKMLNPLISRVLENDKRMELLNGGVFECWTARTEAVRGRKYHYAVIDEAAMIPDATLWQAAIRPLLTDYKGGALFASTPRGRNWFWQLFTLGQSEAYPNWKSWTFPTTANPYIDAAEVEEARAGMPERIFHQEYLATFLEDSGGVFRGLDKVCTGRPLSEPQKGADYIFGVDWGRSKDFTVISVMDKSGRQVHLERFNQIGWTVQRSRLKDLYQRFQPIAIWAESNSIGDVNIDALVRDGIPVRPFTTTHKSKAELIDGLVLAIEREEIQLLNDVILLHELQAFEISRSPTGFWIYGAPPGQHDDTVIATALSYYGIQRSGPPIVFVENREVKKPPRGV